MGTPRCTGAVGAAGLNAGPLFSGSIVLRYQPAPCRLISLDTRTTEETRCRNSTPTNLLPRRTALLDGAIAAGGIVLDPMRRFKIARSTGRTLDGRAMPRDTPTRGFRCQRVHAIKGATSRDISRGTTMAVLFSDRWIGTRIGFHHESRTLVRPRLCLPAVALGAVVTRIPAYVQDRRIPRNKPV